MLQLALRQQQLHAAHMQIKLQHQSKLVVSEHDVHHRHHHSNHLQQQDQRGTSPGVDQVGSPHVVVSAASATRRTDEGFHTTNSPTTYTTSVDQPPLHAITRVCTPLSFT